MTKINSNKLKSKKYQIDMKYSLMEMAQLIEDIQILVQYEESPQNKMNKLKKILSKTLKDHF